MQGMDHFLRLPGLDDEAEPAPGEPIGRDAPASPFVVTATAPRWPRGKSNMAFKRWGAEFTFATMGIFGFSDEDAHAHVCELLQEWRGHGPTLLRAIYGSMEPEQLPMLTQAFVTALGRISWHVLSPWNRPPPQPQPGTARTIPSNLELSFISRTVCRSWFHRLHRRALHHSTQMENEAQNDGSSRMRNMLHTRLLPFGDTAPPAQQHTTAS